MGQSIENQKVAILLATGFDERSFLSLQKTLRNAGAFVRMVSVDAGLVTSWQGTQWGHNYAVDTPINQALSADFSICVIPGGERSTDKLFLSAHTKRFVGGFLAASKPVIAVDEAIDMVGRLGVDHIDSLYPLRQDEIEAGLDMDQVVDKMLDEALAHAPAGDIADQAA